jgi:2-methylcitrate dehydratase PrpD
VAIALLDGAVTLNSFSEAARSKTTRLRQMTKVNVREPFASNYPQAWGSAVRITTDNGNVLESSRRDCKGDPELALTDSEMRTKATGLMRYAGLDVAETETICESILSLPASKEEVKLFSQFISFLDLQ